MGRGVDDVLSMTLDLQLLSQLRQIVSIRYSSATANIYGEIDVGATVATAYCRMERNIASVESPNGTREVAYRPLMILDSSVATPSFSDRFWLPNDSTGTAAYAAKPDSITPRIDELGNLSHWEIGIA